MYLCCTLKFIRWGRKLLGVRNQWRSVFWSGATSCTGATKSSSPWNEGHVTVLCSGNLRAVFFLFFFLLFFFFCPRNLFSSLCVKLCVCVCVCVFVCVCLCVCVVFPSNTVLQFSIEPSQAVLSAQLTKRISKHSPDINPSSCGGAALRCSFCFLTDRDSHSHPSSRYNKGGNVISVQESSTKGWLGISQTKISHFHPQLSDKGLCNDLRVDSDPHPVQSEELGGQPRGQSFPVLQAKNQRN